MVIEFTTAGLSSFDGRHSMTSLEWKSFYYMVNNCCDFMVSKSTLLFFYVCLLTDQLYRRLYLNELRPPARA